MRRKISNFLRKCCEAIILSIKLLVIATIFFTFIITYQIGESIALQNTLLDILTQRVEQSEIINNERMLDVYKDIINILEIEKDLYKNLDGINTNLHGLLEYTNEVAKRTIEIRKDTRIPNFEKLIKANIVLVNKETGQGGSGTIIKYKEKLYILSVAHLDGNSAICLNGDFDWKDVKTIHMDPKQDLALFEFPENVEEVDYDYIEISKTGVKIGDKIWAVGNPQGLDDLVTSGILSKHDGREWLITASIYFGSSGGAVVNKEGELIGIIHAMIISFYDERGMVTIGLAIDLETITRFLEKALGE